MTPKLLIMGGGKMGSALLEGLIAGGWAAEAELAVSEPDGARRKALAEAHPGRGCRGWPGPADGAVLAVKPDVAEAVLRTSSGVGITRVLSIVAGLSSARLEAALPPGDAVVRAMPNTPGPDRCGGGRPCRVAARRPRPTSSGPRAFSVRSVRWCVCPSGTSTRSPPFRDRVRPTFSWWPRR